MKVKLCEIKDIDFNKVTAYFGEHLLNLVGKPIDWKYGIKLRDLKIATISFFEEDSNGEKVYIGELIKKDK